MRVFSQGGCCWIQPDARAFTADAQRGVAGESWRKLKIGLKFNEVMGVIAAGTVSARTLFVPLKLDSFNPAFTSAVLCALCASAVKVFAFITHQSGQIPNEYGRE
jgi:hypothetical protein